MVIPVRVEAPGPDTHVRLFLLEKTINGYRYCHAAEARMLTG